MKTVIVTRHKSFVEYILERGIAPRDSEVITHVSDLNQIEGMCVVGVLPPHLAAHCDHVITVPLNLSLEQRERERNSGEDLTIDDIRGSAGEQIKYRVEILP